MNTKKRFLLVLIFVILLGIQMFFVISETGSSAFFSAVTFKTNSAVSVLSEYADEVNSNKYFNPLGNIYNEESDESIVRLSEYSFYAFDVVTNPLFLVYDFME